MGIHVLQVLTPLQLARFIVAAYPWVPDCLTLCTVVAAQDGLQDAGMMLDAAISKTSQNNSIRLSDSLPLHCTFASSPCHCPVALW